MPSFKENALFITIIYTLYLCVNPLYANAGSINVTPQQDEFVAWDVASQYVAPREVKPYTIMIYMNGSDLESETAAATLDILEMLNSGVSADNVNIVIFTGGTNRWHNRVIPSNECALWEIADGKLYGVSSVGMLDMGTPETLAGFINFGVSNYPAHQYGLIMWDHGGGSIAGFGHDEKFNTSLTLPDMRKAFDAALSNTRLEFIGFDSCLMATVEMAVIASDYASYLIASEDTEPGDGWNYAWLNFLNDYPYTDGGTLGTIITDSFMEAYANDDDAVLSLSVTDLSRVGYVMDALGKLKDQALEEVPFHILAQRRGNTKAFGGGGPRDNNNDMADIQNMAYQFMDLYPTQAEELLLTLQDAVIYSRHNSDIDIGGLSAYYIYEGKNQSTLNTYAALGMNADYTNYLNGFFNRLIRTNTGIIKTEYSLQRNMDEYSIITALTDNENAQLFPFINGESICLYFVSDTKDSSLYMTPAVVNGKDCSIMISFNAQNPQGHILGVRHEEGFIIQKGFDPINQGDTIAFRYQIIEPDTAYLSKDKWHTGNIITETPRIEWRQMRQGDYIGKIVTDAAHNRFAAN